MLKGRVAALGEVLAKLTMAGGAAASGSRAARELAQRSATLGRHGRDDGRFPHLQAATNHRIGLFGRRSCIGRNGRGGGSKCLKHRKNRDEDFGFVDDNHRRDRAVGVIGQAGCETESQFMNLNPIRACCQEYSRKSANSAATRRRRRQFCALFGLLGPQLPLQDHLAAQARDHGFEAPLEVVDRESVGNHA